MRLLSVRIEVGCTLISNYAHMSNLTSLLAAFRQPTCNLPYLTLYVYATNTGLHKLSHITIVFRCSDLEVYIVTGINNGNARIQIIIKKGKRGDSQNSVLFKFLITLLFNRNQYQF